MSDSTSQQSASGSNSTHETCGPKGPPAGQPKPPGGTCTPPADNTPPPLREPDPCEPPECCECPKPPPSTSTCIDALIEDQAREIREAERAKIFKEALETLLKKVNAAKVDYNADSFKVLLDEWKRQDEVIAELIRKLVCAVPCWRCVIECYICPLLYEVRYREEKLYGGGALYGDVHSLLDLRYWHERDLANKKAAFERIAGVLGAWEKPAETIRNALAANKKVVDEANLLALDASKLIYDVFFKVVPLHLAIAPPSGSGVTTVIAAEYTEFCECDEGKPDDCCGPDVGVPSIRERLVGPQPYLVDPARYMDVICCLVKERYFPAKDAYGTAEAAWEKVDTEIKRLAAEVTDKTANLEKNAKAALPKPVDCKTLQPETPSTPGTPAAAR
jgi:hypothetical protein